MNGSANNKDNWSFFRPDGIAVPDCGYYSQDTVDEDLGKRYDNPPQCFR